MTEYHTVYKGPEGETTQWEDIQTRLGNLAPKPKPWKPDAYAPQQQEGKDTAWLDKQDEEGLEAAEDDFADDRELQQYRCAAPAAGVQRQQHRQRKQRHCASSILHSILHSATPAAAGANVPASLLCRRPPPPCAGRLKRLQELRAAAARPRFGALEDIAGSEFVQKVTDASEDYWVACLLHKAGHAGCGLLGAALEAVAATYPASRFVRVVATSAIPHYPDANLPTLLLYRNRACVKSIVGLGAYGGAKLTPEQVALVLNQFGPVCADEDGECGSSGGSGVKGQASEAQLRGLVERLVAQRLERDADDESSDFDD